MEDVIELYNKYAAEAKARGPKLVTAEEVREIVEQISAGTGADEVILSAVQKVLTSIKGQKINYGSIRGVFQKGKGGWELATTEEGVSVIRKVK